MIRTPSVALLAAIARAFLPGGRSGERLPMKFTPAPCAGGDVSTASPPPYQNQNDEWPDQK